jgi:hypothetical protein
LDLFANGLSAVRDAPLATSGIYIWYVFTQPAAAASPICRRMKTRFAAASGYSLGTSLESAADTRH